VIRSDLGERQEAINLFNQALALRRQTGDRNGEAAALNNLGFVHALLGDRQKALDHLDQALAIFRELQSQDGEGATLHHLTLVWKTFGESQLAIFYGKLAVNVYQAMRANLRPLSKELQQSFLKSKEEIYRELADLLIEEGRLAEAQQVIGLLKEEEYFEFIRRDVQAAPSLPGRAELTAEEVRLLDEYKKLADRVTAIGIEISALEASLDRALEQERRLVELGAQRAAANQLFQKFLDLLARELEKTKQASAIERLRESQDMEQALKEIDPGAVAIYTLVTEKKYRAIVVTPYSRKAAEYPIKAADLNRKSLEFRAALMNPRVDPRPLGRELYKILVAPFAKDLREARARVLMWSLDGALRYLPVAALHDGEKYLVESYSNIVVTLASPINLKEQAPPQWKGLGMGVSKAQGGFRPLPAVPEELRAVIRDEADGRATGVLPGRLLLDEQFTEAAMRAALRQQYPLVHIASHFQFHPGNETDSFLLLGDGARLTLAEIKLASNLFAGVDLLALSACNTAMGGEDAEGKEIEGFGALAQRQGAKAVVATLWSVADESTRELMRRFYQLRRAQPEMTKAEALGQAQLALLRGESQKAPYAHPFYWAPFILIGK
jgi:CHAT domain-containing protein